MIRKTARAVRLMKNDHKKRSWTAVVSVVVASVCCLTLLLGVAFGDNVTSSDPLISLSYLEGVFKTQLVGKVQETIDDELGSIRTELTRKINGVRNSMAGQSGTATTHNTQTLSKNSSYAVSNGAELLLISGSATVEGAGLTDITTGAAVTEGMALEENHLYVATGRVLIRTEDTAKLLIRK
jgi:hypothetical protein